MAFASIFVPNFSVQAAVRSEPALREVAFVLVDGHPPLCKVIAVNEKAARSGIECGMMKTDAAQFSGVEIRPHSRMQDKSAHAALLDIGWSVSPRIEDTAENAIVLDLAGLDYLFDSEQDIATRLIQRSSECGFLPNIAIASNIETALIAARGFTGITVIPCGKESEYLSDLPVGVLSLFEEIAETLKRWGVHTCGALAGLPILQLSERLGQEGVRLHTQARGAGSRTLAIAEQASIFEEEMELDDAVEELDPLSFLLGRLLDQLCARLAARSLAAAAIRLRFELQPSFESTVDRKEPVPPEKSADPYESKLELPIPARDSKMLLKLLRLRLQSHRPAAPIRKITLAAEPARLRATQAGLFLPRFPEPEKLELTIARIASVVGEGNVGSPSLADTHQPEGFHMEHFFAFVEAKKAKRDQEDARRPTREQRHSRIPAGFRAFRPPIPAQLELREGSPARAMFQGRRGEVLAASGPWRTSGDWWREDPWQQDEWDLEINFHPSSAAQKASANRSPNLGLYRFYYDALRRNWFVRGVYD
jgi:protein ImuB